MTKKIFFIIISLFISTFFIQNSVSAEECTHKPPTIKELKQLDKVIAQRLNLTDEQMKVLKSNRAKNLKSMETTINKMESLRKEIHNVYILGIPKFQADIRTAPMKIELALLKQNADKIRYENRKNFENLLTPEQKVEFQNFKKELAQRKNK